MKLLTAAAFISLSYEASACASTIFQHVRPGKASRDQHIVRRQTGEIEIPTNQNNVTHWTVDENTRQMQVTDDAFVARDLARFNHHPDIKVYQAGLTRNLTEHLTDISLAYASTDINLHNHDYKIIFGEGDWTLAVESVTGIQNGPLMGLDGGYLPPTNKPVDYDLMTIARWENGWMMEEFLWTDDPLLYRQLGVLPNKPADFLPDLELGPAAPLATTANDTDSSVLNKAAAAQADDALNSGNLTVQSLNLASDALIYGLSDVPLDGQGYIDWLKKMKRAFPDLHLDNRPYRAIVAQGDWTATAAFLNGTHEGELVLPSYMGNQTVAATGKQFDQLHYTIARWSGGKIIGMRVNLDLFGLLAALEIPL